MKLELTEEEFKYLMNLRGKFNEFKDIYGKEVVFGSDTLPSKPKQGEKRKSSKELSPKQKEIKERREKILEMLAESDEPLDSSAFVDELGVSNSTISCDLSYLEKEGKVKSEQVKKNGYSYYEWSLK